MKANLLKRGYGLMVALALTVFIAGPFSPIVAGGVDVVIPNGDPQVGSSTR